MVIPSKSCSGRGKVGLKEVAALVERCRNPVDFGPSGCRGPIGVGEHPFRTKALGHGHRMRTIALNWSRKPTRRGRRIARADFGYRVGGRAIGDNADAVLTADLSRRSMLGR